MQRYCAEKVHTQREGCVMAIFIQVEIFGSVCFFLQIVECIYSLFGIVVTAV